jgi:hypothetical protein
LGLLVVWIRRGCSWFAFCMLFCGVPPALSLTRCSKKWFGKFFPMYVVPFWWTTFCCLVYIYIPTPELQLSWDRHNSMGVKTVTNQCQSPLTLSVWITLVARFIWYNIMLVSGFPRVLQFPPPMKQDAMK